VTESRFRTAARGYLLYGAVYWIGGLYLLSQGVGVMGSMEGRRLGTMAFWALAGLVPLLVIPYLLKARRGWFERWVLSRRDFARVLSLFLVFRAWKVGQVVVHDHGGGVAVPWGGAVSFRTGAVVFLVITVAALAVVARAAWAREADHA
jgi:hypothetical protein